MDKLTPYQEDVYAGSICPYCKSGTKRATETFIYGREYKRRMMICCKNFPHCNSYVGTDDEGITLGRLANKTLRQYKKVAHDSFDKIWKEKYCKRSELYEHMSNMLDLSGEFTHIGMFNEKTCKKVIDWAIQVYKDLTIEAKKTDELFEWYKSQKIKEQKELMK